MRPSRFTRVAAVLAALTSTHCATNPVTGNPNLVLMTESQEIALGRREDGNVRKQYGVYDDPALQQYVRAIGERLAKASHRPELQYRFVVVDSPEINAFALPGGYIYITRGIIAYFNSEAELAGVLGHELGHVTARHSVQQISAAQAADIGVNVLGIFVPQARGAVGGNVINILGGALLSGYGREHELEADRLGAEYLARTGYDPQAMIGVVAVLKNQELFDAEVAKAEGREPRAYHGLFASHPDNDTRLQQVVGEAKRYTQSSTHTGREEFLRRADDLIVGDSPRQGIVRNNHFYHEEMGLAMRFPAGWRVRNGPQNIVARSPGGEALVDLRSGGAAQGSPEEVLRKRLNLGTGTQVTPTEVNGLTAAVVNVTLKGGPTRVMCVFLEKSAYLLAAQAKSSAAFSQFHDELESSLASFHPITSEEKALARPMRLRVITAREGETFAELARKSPLGRFAEGHLRVLNGLYPAGEPVAGQKLKIVE